MSIQPTNTPPGPGADRLGRPVGEQTGVRQLVTERLGEDPVVLARKLRNQQPPMSWNRIAQAIMQSTETNGQERIYLTQEAVRRWVQADDRRRAQETSAAA
jgi:hypothetical protein